MFGWRSNGGVGMSVATASDVARSPEFVQSLERGLAVIRAFDAKHPALTLSEVATATGLSRAAARRFLLTLADLGYVASDGREFSLRPRVLELGHAYLSSLSLPELAEPHLKRLAAEVGESASVAVLDGHDIVYVGRVATSRIMSAAIGVGTRFPAFATSMGRAILGSLPPSAREAFLETVDLPRLTSHTVADVAALRAELERVPAQGYALVDQELEEGLRSVAAPLHDSTGAVIAAVNISAPVRRGDVAEIIADLVPALLRAASDIDADLVRTGVRIR
jgi:IclR family pca regulon transcriptional regulator